MPSKQIFITGASGFVGSRTVDNFLRHGYRVRLAGRNASTCQRMLATHASYEGMVETIVVSDITTPGAFDDAVLGVHGVIHMASPFVHGVEDNERDLIIPAISGTKEILQSTHRFAPQVKRVVVTSSFAAINDFSQGLRAGHVYDESQWNPLTYEETKTDTRGLAYAGSKALAERAAWEYLATTHNIAYTLSTINPVMIYGPPLPGSLSIKKLGESTSQIYRLMNGTLKAVPPTPMPVYVDVRDVAEAHRLAFEAEASGRFALSAGSFTNGSICDLFRKCGLGLNDRVPPDGGDEVTPEHYSVDTSRAREILGLEFRPFEETFVDMAKEFLALEASEKVVSDF